jgi:RND family efflux transporter MFP subunit
MKHKQTCRRKGTQYSANLFVLSLLCLAGCRTETEHSPPESRPVRTILVQEQEIGETAVLTGQLQAKDEAALGFRIGGRMVARPVNTGDQVKSGQLLGQLEPDDEVNALRSVEAQLNAAQGTLIKHRNDFNRQDQLLRNGHTTRARWDQAQQAMRTAQSQVNEAEARMKIAQDRVGHTELRADASGIITAIGAEPGEVVQPGQMIVRIARKDGRDAVFDFPARLMQIAPSDPAVSVFLTGNPDIAANGRIREIGAQADPVTRTFQVRVGLDNPPQAMRLGSTVTGHIRLGDASAVLLPASALTSLNQRPAVWIVDPEYSSVTMRTVEVLRHDPAKVLIAGGLRSGEVVVTAGVQSLHPGQKVRLLNPAM